MAKSANPEKFTISAAELAKGLNITAEKLYEIVDFFDQDSKDEWELKEEEHFVWLIKASRTRLFSEFGAFAIAKYLDANQKQSFWAKVEEFIFSRKAKLRHSFVRKQVLNNSLSFTVRNGHGYLSKKDTLNILVTSYPRLKKAVDDLRTADESLEADKDLFDIENQTYYSLKTIWRISGLLSQELKSKDRQAWCEAVTVSGPKIMKVLYDEKTSLEARVKSAKEAAKKRDKKKCQITGQETARTASISITAHHIFCYHQYPELATSLDNLITMTDAVHKDFHSWNGGSGKPCTANELAEFLALHYPEADEAAVRVHRVGKIYAHLQPKAPVKELTAVR
jgi:hypothetical protein